MPGSLYFAHQPMNRIHYPRKVNQPIGGPVFSALNKVSNCQVEDSDDSDQIMEGASASSKADMPYTNGKRNEKRTYQNVHVAGGRAAVARKVSANLNSDDEIIVRMKQEKHTDKDIAQVLKNAGRVDYNVKTIGSRWKRLRIALAAAKDRELDAGFADWHTVDDGNLLRAADAADQIVYEMKQKIEGMRWEVVGKKLREIQPTSPYSTNACRKRFEALQNGTAVIPPELDDHPGRRETQLAEAKRKHEAQIAQEAEEAIAEVNEKAKATDSSPSHGQKSKTGFQFTTSSKGKQEASTARAAKTARAGRVAILPNGDSEEEAENSVDDGIDSENWEFSNPETPSPIMPRARFHDLMSESSRSHKAPVRSVKASNRISSLPHILQLATDADSDVHLGMFPGLKKVEDMTRDELRNELKLRGLSRDGVKDKLATRVTDARAGKKNLPRSPMPGNPDILRSRGNTQNDPPRLILTSTLGLRQRKSSLSDSGCTVNSKRLKLQNHPSVGSDGPHKGDSAASNSINALHPGVQNATNSTPTSCAALLLEQAPKHSLQPRCQLLLRNFPETFTADAVKALLTACSVVDVKLHSEPGSFIVHCKDITAVEKAVASFHGLVIDGRKVLIENGVDLVQNFPKEQWQAVSHSATASEQGNMNGTEDITCNFGLPATHTGPVPSRDTLSVTNNSTNFA